MLVSKVTVAVGMWVFCRLTRRARLYIPANLTTSLDVRKRSDAMTVLKKKGGIRTFISPRVRSDPLWLLGSDVTGDQSEGNKLTFVFARTTYLGFWRSLHDRAFGLIVGPAFPEPPCVVGIQSRAGSFYDCRPIHGFHSWRG